MGKLLYFALFFCACAAWAQPRLVCETSNPDLSLFKKGERVLLKFSASGLTPGKVLSLEIDVRDHKGARVGKKSVQLAGDAAGNWAAQMDAPSSKFGFYRVWAHLSDGTKLPKLGSRPEGCVTYAVLPDPQKRKLYSMEDSFFGIHGNGSGKADLRPWLGARWQGRSQIYSDGDYAKWLSEKKGNEWVSYSQRCFVHDSDVYSKWPKGELKHLRETSRLSKGKIFADAKGEEIYSQIFGKIVGQIARQKFYNDYNLYQPLWEPDLTMSDEDIISVYRVARGIIKCLDPDARLIGPCFSHLTRTSPKLHEELFKKGFLEYVDEISIHPYIKYPVELNGFVENIRALKRLVKKYGGGRDIKIRANESGAHLPNDTKSELLQMCGQVRANLIMLGEGFASNEPFYGYDHCETVDGDYGLCYNLMLPKVRFGPNKLSPRPSFAALSAASFILEGHKSTGCIDYLSDSVLGYCYADADDKCVAALWNFGDEDCQVDFYAGAPEVQISDIMGNRRKLLSKGGFVRLTLSSEPIYVIGCGAGTYGRFAAKKVKLDFLEKSFVCGETVDISGTVLEDGILEVSFPRKFKLEGVSKKVKAGDKFSLGGKLPKGLKPGRYPVICKLTRGGLPVSGARAVLDIRPAIEIFDVETGFVGGIPAVEFSARNLSGAEISGKFLTRIPGFPEARKSENFSIGKSGEKRVCITFDGLEIPQQLEFELQIRAVLDMPVSDAICRKRANFMRARYVEPSDGDLFSLWEKPNFVEASAYPAKAGEKINGRAFVAYGWNEKYLFARVKFEKCKGSNAAEKANEFPELRFGFAKNRDVEASSNTVLDNFSMGFCGVKISRENGGLCARMERFFDQGKKFDGKLDIPVLHRSGIRGEKSLADEYIVAMPWKYINAQSPLSGKNVAVSFLADFGGGTGFKLFELNDALPRGFGLLNLVK